MNADKGYSHRLNKPDLNLRQINSSNIYPVEFLLGMYKPLNVPKDIFKLENAVQRTNLHNSSNIGYSKNIGSSGQGFNSVYRKQKNGYLNNQTRSSGAMDASASPKVSASSEERVAKGSSSGYSWRKNTPAVTENHITQEFSNGGQTMMRQCVEKVENPVKLEVRSQMTDLEQDMSSIEKILNKRFEKESIDSEKFIRNKLVMALESVSSKNSQRNGNEISGLDTRKEKGRHLHSNKFVEIRNETNAESTKNMIHGDFSDISSNNFYHGNYNSVGSGLFKNNIAQSSALNNRPADMFRAAPIVHANSSISAPIDNSETVGNSMSFNPVGIELSKDPSSTTSSQNTRNNLRTNDQISKHAHNIGLETRKGADLLDNPMWLYKESGSLTVNGPFSTRQMSSLWKSYTFTHKTLFTLTSKYVWGPINLFYPEVKSTFTFIPDLEVLSQRLTDSPLKNDKDEKIKSEDISSIISEIKELQLNSSDHIPAPKLVNSNAVENVSEKSKPEGLNLKGDNPTPKPSNIPMKPQEVDPVTRDIFTRAPWGAMASDILRDKKEVISFQNILREEEISSKEKLRKEAMSRANNIGNSGSVVSDTPKGWKTTPREKPIILMESLFGKIDSPLYYQEKQQVPPQANYSVNLNSGHGWQGWGAKVGRQMNTDMFGGIAFSSFSDFSAMTAHQNSQKGFWEMCNSDSKHHNSVWNNRDCSFDFNTIGNDLGTEVIDRRVVNNHFVEVDGTHVSADASIVEEPKLNSNNPQGQKSKKKKGKRVDSSLLAFGIRSDRPRNLNYDLD
ncbi:hypothetical protein OJ253_3747 [Cryptosporidium canis]|uniref:GYF domain-containing protein n=1 Tax=Cryptosporidium canis TaxID=195482 RepID=A0A9D5DFZ4_9CRYT|nr:hypothetical protein OJ253_3747 [Cryptosporidium canis]